MASEPRPVDRSDLLDRAHLASVALFDAIDRRAVIESQLDERRAMYLVQLIEDGWKISEAERQVAADTVTLRRDLLFAVADVDRARVMVEHWKFLVTSGDVDPDVTSSSMKGRSDDRT